MRLALVVVACALSCSPAPSKPVYGDVPLSETLIAPSLSAPVEVVRDEAGIPHISGQTDADVVYAQGYFMAMDRWLQMEAYRRQASGTVAELFGTLLPTLIDSDISMRAHHLKRNSEELWAQLQASTDPADVKAAKVLRSFTAGVNAWQADLKAGKRALQPQLGDLYGRGLVTPWSEADCLLLGEMQAFFLAFDGESEIARSRLEEAQARVFHNSADAVKRSRDGFVDDFLRFAPFDPTFTVDGWPNARITKALPAKRATKPQMSLAKLDAVQKALHGVGLDRFTDPSRGSNNFIVSGALTETGLPMVANDTHLLLLQPAIFYLCHLESKEGLNVMGVQFPGIPLVILGQNQHIAWGSTVSYIDVTDVYRETVKDCAAAPGEKCVVFKGAEVKLVKRVEHFNIGSKGRVLQSMDVTFFDVPHHGPIVLRTNQGVVDPLGTEEYSIRYTGHEPAPLFRAIAGIVAAKNVDEFRTSIEQHFKYGGQNWVVGDDSGNILWTQAVRAPRRPRGTQPWKVLPGDGSAEWQGDHDVKWLPAAKNPAKGFFATANADPVGVTADNDPMNEPDADGFPLYLAADYDRGTRVGRITKRLLAATANGRKLTRDDLASIQADAKSEYGEAIAPGFLEAARALKANLANAAEHPELTAIAQGMSVNEKAALDAAITAVDGWSSDTPAGNDGETAEQLKDSRAALLVATFTTKLANVVLKDELTAVGGTLFGPHPTRMLALMISRPTELRTADKVWDDLTTPAVETRLEMESRAVAQALAFIVNKPELGADPASWRWGTLHQVNSSFPVPLGLDMPRTPRHGGDGTVDVGFHGVADDDYSYEDGAAIRFVSALDPSGPKSRNVIVGGQIYYKDSVHFDDLFKKWVKNETVDLSFAHDEIISRAKAEHAANGNGRFVFQPK